MAIELKHKSAKGKTPFTWITFKEIDINRVLELLDKKQDSYTCHYCGDVVDVGGLGGILPDMDGGVIFICNCPICMIEYMDEFLEEIEIPDKK